MLAPLFPLGDCVFMLCWLDVDKCNVRNVQTIFSILLNACFLSTILQPGSLFLIGLLNPNEGIFTYNELFKWVFMLGMDAGESNSHNSIKAFGWLWMWAHKSLKLFSKFTHFKMLQLECAFKVSISGEIHFQLKKVNYKAQANHHKQPFHDLELTEGQQSMTCFFMKTRVQPKPWFSGCRAYSGQFPAHRFNG